MNVTAENIVNRLEYKALRIFKVSDSLKGIVFTFIIFSIYSMVLKLDGYLVIGAHVKSDIGYLICSRHLFRLRAVTNQKFF